MKASHRQAGVVLPVALIMLVLCTMIAVTAITMSSTSVQIVGNAQFRDEAVAAAQHAIENVISSTSFTINPPEPQDVAIGNATYRVTFDPAPTCLKVRPVEIGETGVPRQCYGSPGTTYCYSTTWNVTAVVQDSGKTGARITVHNGVRLIVGLDSALTSCGI
jgi:Tfp pilus assembly protein PilX